MPDAAPEIRPGQRLAAMRATAPLVQNITNYVAMNVMANVMLAAGASPAMVHAREEAAEFARLASALTVNIGTLSAPWLEGMREAVRAANETGKPWVLDPVAVFATAFRREAGAELVELRPAVIRGNASEILGLAGAAGAGKGVDAGDAVSAAEDAARALAARTQGVVAVTGPEDFVTDGTRAVRIANGHPLMPKLTALGCALTGVVAAFLATGDSPLEDTAAALAYFGLAGETAALGALGPGSFQPRFLDALSALDAQALDAGARIRQG
ncbi:MAG: hydroxyethylthiazole kinase [Pseudomonadota bacterium]